LFLPRAMVCASVTIDWSYSNIKLELARLYCRKLLEIGSKMTKRDRASSSVAGLIKGYSHIRKNRLLFTGSI